MRKLPRILYEPRRCEKPAIRRGRPAEIFRVGLYVAEEHVGEWVTRVAWIIDVVLEIEGSGKYTGARLRVSFIFPQNAGLQGVRPVGVSQVVRQRRRAVHAGDRPPVVEGSRGRVETAVLQRPRSESRDQV